MSDSRDTFRWRPFWKVDPTFSNSHSALDYLLDNIGYRVRLAMLRIAFTPAPHLAVDGSKSIYIAIPSRYPYSAEKEDRSRIARLRQTLMNKNFSTNHTGGR